MLLSNYSGKFIEYDTVVLLLKILIYIIFLFF